MLKVLFTLLLCLPANAEGEFVEWDEGKRKQVLAKLEYDREHTWEPWLQGMEEVAEYLQKVNERGADAGVEWIRPLIEEVVSEVKMGKDNSSEIKAMSDWYWVTYISDPNNEGKYPFAGRRVSVAEGLLAEAVKHATLSSDAFPIYLAQRRMLSSAHDLSILRRAILAQNENFESRVLTPVSREDAESEWNLSEWYYEYPERMYLESVNEVDAEFIQIVESENAKQAEFLRYSMGLSSMKEDEIEREVERVFSEDEGAFLNKLAIVEALRRRGLRSPSVEQWLQLPLASMNEEGAEERFGQLERLLPVYFEVLMEKDPVGASSFLKSVCLAYVEGETLQLLRYLGSSASHVQGVEKYWGEKVGKMLELMSRRGDVAQAVQVARCLFLFENRHRGAYSLARSRVGQWDDYSVEQLLGSIWRSGLGKVSTDLEMIQFEENGDYFNLFGECLVPIANGVRNGPRQEKWLSCQYVARQFPEMKEEVKVPVGLSMLRMGIPARKGLAVFLESGCYKGWHDSFLKVYVRSAVGRQVPIENDGTFSIPKWASESQRESLQEIEDRLRGATGDVLGEVLAVSELESEGHLAELINLYKVQGAVFRDDEGQRDLEVVTHLIRLAREFEDAEFDSSESSYFNSSKEPTLSAQLSYTLNFTLVNGVKRAPSLADIWTAQMVEGEYPFYDPLLYQTQIYRSKYGAVRYTGQSEFDAVVSAYTNYQFKDQLEDDLLGLASLKRSIGQYPEPKECREIYDWIVENERLDETNALLGLKLSFGLYSARSFSVEQTEYLVQQVKKYMSGYDSQEDRLYICRVIADMAPRLFADEKMEEVMIEAVEMCFDRLPAHEKFRVFRMLTWISRCVVTERFHVYYKKYYSFLRGQMRSGDHGWSQDSTWMRKPVALLTLALQSGEQALVDEVLRVYHRELAGNHSILLTLLRHGQIDHAERFIGGCTLINRERDYSHWYVLHHFWGGYDRALESHLNEFVRRAPRDVDRLYFRDLLKALPSCVGERSVPVVSRKERLVQLSESLKNSGYDIHQKIHLISSAVFRDSEGLKRSGKGEAVELFSGAIESLIEELMLLEQGCRPHSWYVYSHPFELYAKWLVSNFDKDGCVRYLDRLKEVSGKRWGYDEMYVPFELAIESIQDEVFSAVLDSDEDQLRKYLNLLDVLMMREVADTVERERESLVFAMYSVCAAALGNVTAGKNLMELGDEKEGQAVLFGYGALRYASYQGRLIDEDVNRELYVKLMDQQIAFGKKLMEDQYVLYSNAGNSSYGWKYLEDKMKLDLLLHYFAIDDYDGAIQSIIARTYKDLNDLSNAVKWQEKAVEATEIATHSPRRLVYKKRTLAEYLYMSQKYEEAYNYLVAISLEGLKKNEKKRFNKRIEKYKAAKEAAAVNES